MVYKIDVLNIEWKKVKDKDLNSDIFNDKNINEGLIHEFVLMQLANTRNPIAHTKTRWEVKTSGKKLFRQKGTWRARVWDAWSPIRRHWWVAFWPRNNVNHHKDMPKAMRRKALFGSLTLKARDNEIICIENYPYNNIKTSDAVNVIKNLWLDNQKLLLVLSNNEQKDTIIKSFRNIENIKYLFAEYVNPYDLLTYKKVLFLEESLDNLQSIFVK